MSHTFTVREGLYLHYNSDMSGDVLVVEKTHAGFEPMEGEPLVQTREMKIPAKAFLEFVAEYVRGERITKLEDATTEELLGLLG